jgi:hypothetical protein
MAEDTGAHDPREDDEVEDEESIEEDAADGPVPPVSEDAFLGIEGAIEGL